MKQILVLALFSATLAPAQSYTKDGELLLPKDYRNWVFLTSSIGMNYPSEGPPKGSPSFGNVFVNPKAMEGFSKTGLWPDKTVLLIEIREAENRPGLDKNARFQTNVVGFDAHVKDASRGGWNFYFIPKDAESGKPFAKDAACFTCHEKNAAVDTTFVQYYPTLIEIAKKHGTYKTPGGE